MIGGQVRLPCLGQGENLLYSLEYFPVEKEKTPGRNKTGEDETTPVLVIPGAENTLLNIILFIIVSCVSFTLKGEGLFIIKLSWIAWAVLPNIIRIHPEISEFVTDVVNGGNVVLSYVCMIDNLHLQTEWRTLISRDPLDTVLWLVENISTIFIFIEIKAHQECQSNYPAFIIKSSDCTLAVVGATERGIYRESYSPSSFRLQRWLLNFRHKKILNGISCLYQLPLSVYHYIVDYSARALASAIYRSHQY